MNFLRIFILLVVTLTFATSAHARDIVTLRNASGRTLQVQTHFGSRPSVDKWQLLPRRGTMMVPYKYGQTLFVQTSDGTLSAAPLPIQTQLFFHVEVLPSGGKNSLVLTPGP